MRGERRNTGAERRGRRGYAEVAEGIPNYFKRLATSIHAGCMAKVAGSRMVATCLWLGLGLVSGMNTGQNAEGAEVTQKSQKGYRKNSPLWRGTP